MKLVARLLASDAILAVAQGLGSTARLHLFSSSKRAQVVEEFV
jgi:hypothetical protein